MKRYALDRLLPELNLTAQPLPVPLVEAAREALAWYHRRLLELQPGPIDRLLAVDLTRVRDWALAVLAERGGKGYAKQQQVEITGGRPLALCTGGRKPYPVQTDLGLLPAYSTGCFRIWEEPTRTSGRKWGSLCPNCRDDGGHRKPSRDAKNELEKRVSRYVAGRTGTP